MQTFPTKINENGTKTLATFCRLCYKQWIEKREEWENSGFYCAQRGSVVG